MKIKKVLAAAVLSCIMLLCMPISASAAEIPWESIWNSIDWDAVYSQYPDYEYDNYFLSYNWSTGNIDLEAWEISEIGYVEHVLKEGVYYYGSLTDCEGKVYDREQEADALAIKATGIPHEAWQAAAEEGKSIAEHLNNLVITVPGLDEAVPVGQGGGVVIDGEATGATISIQKPLLAHVDSAKSMASTIGGKVLNVVSVKTSAVFGTATVNFYMPGVTADQNIQVYKYDAGQWTSVNVSEVREDHVVADLTSLGIIAFVEVQ